MSGAFFTVELPEGFLNGYDYDLVLLVIAIHIVLNGSKLYHVITFYLKLGSHKEITQHS
ncbi:hypothetical protein [Halobacillus karajensis]|uniref:hypothetical protein n=1 Tax=Halobacillus karajensis TaxID=195088 RepID=UPI0018CC2FD9|nr:hypothetical protein [Halobacillus karajensis]